MQLQYQYRYFGAFRLLLALMVAVSHFQVTHAPLAARPFLLPLGEVAVLLFFILSGYIITEALFIFYNGRPGAFIANRFFRIFPPYFAALAISAGFHLAVQHFHLPLLGLEHDYGFAINQKNIFKNTYSLLDWRIPQGKEDYYLFVRYIWAVVIEWQYYVVAMLIFFLVSKRQYQAQLAAVILVFLAAYLFASRFGDFPSGTIPFFSQYFLLGIILYGITIRRSLGRLGKCLPWIAGSVTLLVLHDYITIWKYEAIVGLILLIGIAAIFVLTLSNDTWFSNGNVKKIDNKLGNLSYPLYLNHYAAEIGMYSLTNERSWSILFIAVSLSLVISVMAFFITEPLTIRIRNAIRGQSLSQ